MAISVPPPLESLLDLLFEEKAQWFLDRIGERFPATFRFNPLKHDRELQEEILKAQSFTFTERELPSIARVEKEPTALGKSLSHFLGHLYIQDLASTLPPLVLRPQPGWRVLDACAAPGSKTTHLAALMQNRGALIANDVSRKRLHPLIFNLRRMGVANTAVLRGPAERFGNSHYEFFDGVLLDAPCSALGTLHKSPEVLSWWSEEKTKKLASIQKSMLHTSLKALKPGGVLVYSTCTLSPLENEAVVDFALRNFPVELEKIRLPGIAFQPGLREFEGLSFDLTLDRTIRVDPFANDSEAFYIARLRKTDGFGEPRGSDSREPYESFGPAALSRAEEALSRLQSYFELPPSTWREWHLIAGKNDLIACSPELPSLPLYEEPVRFGLPVGNLRRSPHLTTEGAHFLTRTPRRHLYELAGFEELQKYVNRQPIPAESVPSHHELVLFREYALGHAISSQGEILSRFPRTGWNFSFRE